MTICSYCKAEIDNPFTYANFTVTPFFNFGPYGVVWLSDESFCSETHGQEFIHSKWKEAHDKYKMYRTQNHLKVEFGNGVVIGLDTEITTQLAMLGYIAELIHRINDARKMRGLAIQDKISVEVSGEFQNIIRAFEGRLREESLVESIAHVGEDHCVGWLTVKMLP